MRYIIIAIFATVLMFMGRLIYHVGYFKPVELAEKQIGPHFLLYKDHVGPYHKITPLIEEIEAWAKQQNIPCLQTFGRFNDDPDFVEEERLRSDAGCILSDLVGNAVGLTLPDIESKSVRVATKQFPNGYRLEKLEARNYLTALFDGAPSIGPIKVYPLARDYATGLGKLIGNPIIEIYTIKDEDKMTTQYLFPLVGPK